MKLTVHMPFGDGENRYDAAVVVAWGPQIGELVTDGQALLRVAFQDGSERSIPSPATGILFRWTILEGDAIEPGEPIAVLAGVADESPVEAPPPPFDGPETPFAPTPQEAALAEHHRRSLSMAPHQSTVTVAALDEVDRLIARAGESFAAREGFALERLPFVVAAFAAALRRFPRANGRWVDGGLRMAGEVRIALPQACGERLCAPVLRDADRLSVLALAREIGRLKAAARADALTEKERYGATVTVTDLTDSGALFQTPILHQPQVAHLAVGAPLDSRLHLCLAADARALESRIAAELLGTVRASLERADFLFVGS